MQLVYYIIFFIISLLQINATKNDLISSGLGKTVTELRKFENLDIREKAEKLRFKWKSDIVCDLNKFLLVFISI